MGPADLRVMAVGDRGVVAETTDPTSGASADSAKILSAPLAKAFSRDTDGDDVDADVDADDEDPIRKPIK